MYFNYLVKIPKNINSKPTNDNDSFDELDMHSEVENIVYSNYIKKLNDELLENASVEDDEDDHKDDPKVDDLEDDNDDDSVSSDSNITVSSFENNNSNDSFF